MTIRNRCLLASFLLTMLLSPAVQAQSVACKAPAPPNTEADHALLAGDAPKAEILFHTLLSSGPSPANYVGLVRAQLEQDKLVEALTSAHQAIAAFATSADVHASLGDVLTRSGDIPAASDAYIQAIALNPCSASAHFGFGRLNDLSGRHLTAAKQFNLAHRLSPGDPEITATLLHLLPPEKRLASLRDFLATQPALPPLRLDELARELTILSQHLTCQTETFNAQSFDLEPLLQNGRYRRSWGLKTRINDAALPLLELDTTVDGIVLSTEDAIKAKVRPLTSAPTDPSASFVGVADEIHVGEITYRHCPVTVVPDNQVDHRNSLIGASFFRDHVIHIDYVARTMKLTPLPASPNGPADLTDQFFADDEKNWSPIYIVGPTVLLPTLINKKGPFLFAIDTGVGPSIFSPAVTKSELSSSKDATLNLQGYSGRVVKVIPRDGGGVVDVADIRDPEGKPLHVGRPVKVPVLRFAGNEIPDLSAVSFNITPMSHERGVEISALLGFDILSYYSIDLNYRDALAHIPFDQNRRYHVQAAERAY